MNMPKIDFRSTKVRVVAVIILVGIGVGVAWQQLVYTERSQTLAGLKTDLEKKQNKLNSILAMKPQLSKLRQDSARAAIKLDSLRSIFPDRKEIPRLIRDITKVAQAAGIETRRFSPLPDVERDYFIENRYDMTVAGGYHQLGNFLSFLANLPLLINLSDVTLTAVPQAQPQKAGGADQSDQPTVVASFKMTTFSSKR